jgi:hypothetical protein
MTDSHRRVFSELACWLILFQLLVPLAFASMDKATICSATGAQQIVLDANGYPIELPSNQRHCDLCIVQAPQHPLLLANGLTLPDVAHSSTNISVLPKALAHSHSLIGFHTRAPPILS